MLHINIVKWGNSLGLRIPKSLANRLNVQVGDTLEIAPTDEGLLLKKPPQSQKSYVLSEILDSFVPSSTHSEVDFGPKQGREVW